MQFNISYRKQELQGTKDIESIRNASRDGVIFWAYGISSGYNDTNGHYFILMDFRGNIRLLDGPMPGGTSHQAILSGLTEATEQLKKPISVYIASSPCLQLQSGLKGTSKNTALMQKLFKQIENKGCSLIEWNTRGITTSIRDFVFSKSASAQAMFDAHTEAQSAQMKEYCEQYYRECRDKAVALLRNVPQIDARVIDAISVMEYRNER